MEIFLSIFLIIYSLLDLRGLRSWVGFRQTALTYDRPKRILGNSKYTARKLYALATDGIASSSIRPLRIAQSFCFFFIILTGLFIFYVGYQYLLLSRSHDIGLWFLGGYALLAFTASVQTFCLYLLGAYVGRMYLEVKGRPSFIVQEVIHPLAEGRNDERLS